ncbi:hypothetical protein PMAYCL1PPCAC_14802, partial [Pristionchus mayeri]
PFSTSGTGEVVIPLLLLVLDVGGVGDVGLGQSDGGEAGLVRSVEGDRRACLIDHTDAAHSSRRAITEDSQANGSLDDLDAFILGQIGSPRLVEVALNVSRSGARRSRSLSGGESTDGNGVEL